MATTSFAKPTSGFSKTAGAGSSAPIENVEVVATPSAAPSAAIKLMSALGTALDNQTAAPSAPATVGFYTGEEEGAEDSADVRLPRLNMIQGLSKPELKALGKEGDWVLKGSLLLPSPVTIVAVGHRPKVWIEKVKHGEQARYARSLQEVADMNGTDESRLSKANEKSDSKKTWFMPSATWLLLIQRPEGADDAYFPFVSDDGIAFAAALYTTKSTSYGTFHVPLSSEKATGLLRSGYSVRNIELTSQKGAKHPAFEPRIRITTPTSEGVRALAKKAINTLA